MNKKGFTLVELLAVIIILGIIALIAIPIVSNVINDSKKNAAKVSALSYIQAIDNQNALAKLQPNKYIAISSGNVEDLIVNIKGDTPTEGTVTIENGTVKEVEFCISGYIVTYENKKVTVRNKCDESLIVFNGTMIKPAMTDTHKGVVYLNPKDLSIVCNESNSQIGTGVITATGCMKFYIFDDAGSKYKMILDHNTTEQVEWIKESDYISAGGTATEYGTNGNTSKGPITVIKKLKVDTADWLGNPRLITANEIAKIVGADALNTLQWNSSKEWGESIGTQSSWFYLDGNGTSYSKTDGWKKQVATSTNKSKYAWLYDFTNCADNGCNNVVSNIFGYWTSDSIVNRNDNAWVVICLGRLNNNIVSDSSHGVRPVIELPKSYFK